MRALDLFRGAGGWSVACDALGIVDYGVDNMPEANATAGAAGFTTFHEDVWTLDAIDMPLFDGQIASAPCQTFSQAGKGAGRQALDNVVGAIRDKRYLYMDDLRRLGDEVGDERTALVLTPLHFAYWGRPEWIAWEQVFTVQPVWDACAAELRTLGYNVWTGVLHAEQYGVPQTRKRAVLIANRTREVSAPHPTHSKYHSRTPERLDAGAPKWISMAEGLGWAIDGNLVEQHRVLGSGMEERYGKAIDRTAGAPSYTIRGSASAAAPGGGYVLKPIEERIRERLSAEKMPTGESRVRDQSGTAIDLAWVLHRPSTTVASRDLVQHPGTTANRFSDSTKSRNDGIRLTVEECGLIQSFPADYPWQGTKAKQHLQVGNAVPPLLAQHVLSAASGVQVQQEREEIAA